MDVPCLCSYDYSSFSFNNNVFLSINTSDNADGPAISTAYDHDVIKDHMEKLGKSFPYVLHLVKIFIALVHFVYLQEMVCDESACGQAIKSRIYPRLESFHFGL